MRTKNNKSGQDVTKKNIKQKMPPKRIIQNAVVPVNALPDDVKKFLAAPTHIDE
jgi:hypothetical protein